MIVRLLFYVTDTGRPSSALSPVPRPLPLALPLSPSLVRLEPLLFSPLSLRLISAVTAALRHTQ